MQEIICLLDASGSMSSCANDALGGFNQFLIDQKNFGDAHLTAIWFDNDFEVFYDGMISKCQPITKWKTNGMTALYDAIGKTFAHVNPRFSRESPEKVILAILTDGEENSSKEFTMETAGNLIKEHQEKYGWDVIFLGANQDVWKTSKDLNINTAVIYDAYDTKNAFVTYSSIISRSRSGHV